MAQPAKPRLHTASMTRNTSTIRTLMAGVKLLPIVAIPKQTEAAASADAGIKRM